MRIQNAPVTASCPIPMMRALRTVRRRKIRSNSAAIARWSSGKSSSMDQPRARCHSNRRRGDGGGFYSQDRVGEFGGGNLVLSEQRQLIIAPTAFGSDEKRQGRIESH